MVQNFASPVELGFALSLCLWTHSKQFTQDLILNNVEVNDSIIKTHSCTPYVFTSRLLRVCRPGESDKGEKKKKKHKALQALVSEGQDVIRTVQTLIEQVREYLTSEQLNLSHSSFLPLCVCVCLCPSVSVSPCPSVSFSLSLSLSPSLSLSVCLWGCRGSSNQSKWDKKPHNKLPKTQCDR